MKTYWLETNDGVRTPLDLATEEPLERAREIYPADGDVQTWIVARDVDDDDDYFLVPGGPDGEEFTWCPRE